MTILDKIIENKRYEVARSKAAYSISLLEKSDYFDRPCVSLSNALLQPNATGIISEFKRKSPSKGIINSGAGIAETTVGYASAGASGLSVLTDTVFFGGFKEDVTIARQKNATTPVLRKDFMIDTYQIFEAKAWGADVILLIAAALSPEEIAVFSKQAHELGMEVLLEVHDKEELQRSPLELIDIVGVNNRNLKNFSENNINASLELASLIPAEKVKISESCISTVATIQQLREAGYKGFLMGETFMKMPNPANALKMFVEEMRN